MNSGLPPNAKWLLHIPIRHYIINAAYRALLELDTYSRTTANAIARLIKRRNRKR